VPELGVDALKAAHPVLAALWRYSDELSTGPVHPLVGAGFVLPTGIEGGGYIAVPGECAISLIAKIPPGVDLDRVREGLEKAARAAIVDDRIRLEFSYPASRDHRLGGTAFEDAPDEARLERLRSAVRAVRPDRGAIEAAPYWSELPIFAALGIPGVYFAPGDIRICHTPEETVTLQDYYDGVLALALLSKQFSPRSRAQSSRFRSIPSLRVDALGLRSRQAQGWQIPAEAFRPAVAAGVKIVLLSNKPKDFVQGKDYVTIVTDDLFQMGKHAADALAAALGKKGKIAFIYHDAQYYVTNQRDNAFKAMIEPDYPDISIVAKQGLADPARAQDIAQVLLLKNSDLDGIYVTWGRTRGRRACGAPGRRKQAYQDRHARPLGTGRSRHGQGRQCRRDRRGQGL